MSYSKIIVCLTKSWKHGGSCVAGKEIALETRDGKKLYKIGSWIRPISDTAAGVITNHLYYNDGTPLNILDIIGINFSQPRPEGHQSENHLIVAGDYWKKICTFEASKLDKLVDNLDGELWFNGYSSYNGLNDRVPVSLITEHNITSSLYFIKPLRLDIIVNEEYLKRKLRASFILNGFNYTLPVTDPLISRMYSCKDYGSYPVDTQGVYMCLSLGEQYHGDCYKLVASIIGIEDSLSEGDIPF